MDAISVRRDAVSVGVTWTDSADKHEIPHNEALYAMSHPHHVVREFGDRGSVTCRQRCSSGQADSARWRCLL